MPQPAAAQPRCERRTHTKVSSLLRPPSPTDPDPVTPGDRIAISGFAISGFAVSVLRNSIGGYCSAREGREVGLRGEVAAARRMQRDGGVAHRAFPPARQLRLLPAARLRQAMEV